MSISLEVLDLGSANPDEVVSGDYDNVVIGYGSDFEDSIFDAISLISDLTNCPTSDIMGVVKENYPEKFGVNSPGDSIDAMPRGKFYSVAVRFTTCKA